MIMNAVITQIQPEYLLVTDLSNNQEVMVHFNNSNRLSVGDTIEITYNGAMTSSIPPQITAQSIRFIRFPQPPRPPVPTPPTDSTSSIRAVVLRRDRGSLLVYDIQNDRIVRANYWNSNQFRVGQIVVIFYDTITMSQPPVINAVEIRRTQWN